MDYEDFAHWIAKQIFFKEVKDDLFVELTCRKLAELGIVEKRDNEWFYTTADDTNKQDHVEWIALENAYGEIKYKCSHCGHFVKSGTDKNFCPNCGAKMTSNSAK